MVADWLDVRALSLNSNAQSKGPSLLFDGYCVGTLTSRSLTVAQLSGSASEIGFYDYDHANHWTGVQCK